MTDNKVLEITPDVHWVGVLDKELVTFDVVMQTPYGTTYNSYFINAHKKALVETVKVKYFDTFLEKLNHFITPQELDYIIVNHTEPDHSGSLVKLLEMAPNATVVGSGNAIRYLNDLLGRDFKHQIVKDGDVVDLGNKKLKVIAAPNLHWPDSIYTYLEEDKVLFTCDSFGAHFCHEEMYDDKVGNWDDAFKYYFDVILKPFSKFMLKAIEKIRPLDIEAICTGHGPILRSHWKRYVDMSEKLAKEATQEGNEPMVFIPYVSAYHNTGDVAKAIAEGVKSVKDVKVELHDIETMPIEEIDKYLSHCTGLIIGTPTINQNILLPIYQLFALINPIRDKGKLVSGFGSYGWSGESAKILPAVLTNLKLKYFEEGFFFKFTPHDEQKEKAFAFGKLFVENMIKNSVKE